MSLFGKEDKAIRRKSVAYSRTPSVAVRKIRFAHSATLGQTLINLNSLVTPSDMPTFVNASPAEIAAARLTVNKKNLSLKSSLGGVLIQDLDYVVTSSTTINLIGSYATDGAEDGEIFEGIIDGSPVSDLIVSEGRNIKGTVEVAVGQTTVNLGSSFKINENASSQMGSVKVWRNGVLQLRNVGNATATLLADGNYQEIDSGNGYGTTIVLNAAPAVQADIIQYEIGFHTYSGDVQIMSDLERQQSSIQKIAQDLAIAVGNPVTDYITASPTEIERRALGDQVIDHENRIDALENPNTVAVSVIKNAGVAPATTATRVSSWTAKSFDAWNAFDLAAGTFTVPSGKGGIYSISFYCAVVSSSDYWLPVVFINGAEFARGATIVGSAGLHCRASIVCAVSVSAGDIIDIRGFDGNSSGETFSTSSTETRLSIFKV